MVKKINRRNEKAKKQNLKIGIKYKTNIKHKNSSSIAHKKMNLSTTRKKVTIKHNSLTKILQKRKEVRGEVARSLNVRKSKAIANKADVSETVNKKSISEVKQKINNLENKDLNNYLLNLDAAAAATEDLHKRGRRKKENKNIPKPEEAEEIITSIFNNKDIVGFLTKNVSKRSTEVLNMLVSPMTDEEIAIKLDLKINNVRRILNLMQGYGLTKYYIAKNSNGWLSFAWYINIDKVDTFFNYVRQERGNVLKEDCNDYFICNSCGKKSNIVLTFDEAFDNGFKCASCGNSYDRIEQEDVKKLIY